MIVFSSQDASKFITMCIAFLAFSYAASGIYTLNDLWHMENDRPRKRDRPFANVLLQIKQGLAVSVSALGFAFFLSAFVSPAFALMLLFYVVLATAYSWVLKTYVLIDELMLSLLYTLRILAGSVAVAILTSFLAIDALDVYLADFGADQALCRNGCT